MGKMYGANVMRKAKREESDAKARMKLRASENANVPWTLGILTDEELAAFEELVEEHEDDEGKGPHVSATVMEIEGEEPAVRATPLESAGEEKTPRVEELGIQPTGKQKKAKVCSCSITSLHDC